MQFTYLLLNLGAIAFPLGLSFDRRVSFVRKWKAVFPTMAAVGIPFVIWDIIATLRGHWAFNPRYNLGISFAGLPLEEMLFFVTVPYACLFTYECLHHYMPDRDLKIPRLVPLILGPACILSSLAVWPQEYTAVVLVVFGMSLIVLGAFGKELVRSMVFLVFIGAITVVFVLMNYILTGFPVVTYSDAHIWGTSQAWDYRFLTIPFEDFLYNLSMMFLYLTLYINLKRFSKVK